MYRGLFMLYLSSINIAMNRNYILHRILHWCIGFVILFILLTVFLRLNWMNKDIMASILSRDLSALGIQITYDDAVKIAKDIRRPMWNTHIYAGYILTGLFVFKMILVLIKGASFDSPFCSGNSRRKKFQSWVYVFFYFFLGVSLATGLLIEMGPANWKAGLEAIHSLSLYYVIPFLALHFFGILFSKIRKEREASE